MTAPVEPAPVIDVPEPITEPRHNWDDDPRTAARYDDRYWDAKYDNDEAEGGE